MESFQDFVDVNELTTRLVAFLPKLLAGVLVMIGFWILYRATRRPLRLFLDRIGLHEKLVHLLVNSVYRYTLVIFGLVMGLSQLGVDVGAALAGIGVAGIAVGFAAQDSLSNTIAGFVIFWDKPFTVGDWITAERQYGKVQDITMRSTRIRTPRNTFVVVPNRRIIDTVLENYSKHGEMRVDVPVGIAYKEDVRAAREVILEAMERIDHLRTDPPPSVVTTELGGSSVNLDVRVWIDEGDQQRRTQFEVVEACKLALDRAGIQIPFPHLQLFWDDVEDRVVEKLKTVTGA